MNIKQQGENFNTSKNIEFMNPYYFLAPQSKFHINNLVIEKKFKNKYYIKPYYDELFNKSILINEFKTKFSIVDFEILKKINVKNEITIINRTT